MSKALQEAAQSLEPKIVKISEELSCELNDVEWQNKARELAEAHKEVAHQEQRKKDVMKELGHDVSIAKSKESKLADIVSTRRELRDVTVVVKYDYDLGQVSRTRTDTGEIISTRDMTDSERQEQLEMFVDANEVIEARHEEEADDDDPEAEAPAPKVVTAPTPAPVPVDETVEGTDIEDDEDWGELEGEINA